MLPPGSPATTTSRTGAGQVDPLPRGDLGEVQGVGRRREDDRAAWSIRNRRRAVLVIPPPGRTSSPAGRWRLERGPEPEERAEREREEHLVAASRAP